MKSRNGLYFMLVAVIVIGFVGFWNSYFYTKDVSIANYKFYLSDPSFYVYLLITIVVEYFVFCLPIVKAIRKLS